MVKAWPLSAPRVMLSLRCYRYYGQLRLPCRFSETSCPYIHRLLLLLHRHSLPSSFSHCITSVTPGVHLFVTAVIVRIDVPVFPNIGEGRQRHYEFRGYIRVRSRCGPQVCSTSLKSLYQETQRFRLPFAPPSSYLGELPNFHGRTSTD